MRNLNSSQMMSLLLDKIAAAIDHSAQIGEPAKEIPGLTVTIAALCTEDSNLAEAYSLWMQCAANRAVEFKMNPKTRHCEAIDLFGSELHPSLQEELFGPQN